MALHAPPQSLHPLESGLKRGAPHLAAPSLPLPSTQSAKLGCKLVADVLPEGVRLPLWLEEGSRRPATLPESLPPVHPAAPAEQYLLCLRSLSGGIECLPRTHREAASARSRPCSRHRWVSEHAERTFTVTCMYYRTISEISLILLTPLRRMEKSEDTCHDDLTSSISHMCTLEPSSLQESRSAKMVVCSCIGKRCASCTGQASCLPFCIQHNIYREEKIAQYASAFQKR